MTLCASIDIINPFPFFPHSQLMGSLPQKSLSDQTPQLLLRVNPMNPLSLAAVLLDTAMIVRAGLLQCEQHGLHLLVGHAMMRSLGTSR